MLRLQAPSGLRIGGEKKVERGDLSWLQHPPGFIEQLGWIDRHAGDQTIISSGPQRVDTGWEPMSALRSVLSETTRSSFGRHRSL